MRRWTSSAIKVNKGRRPNCASRSYRLNTAVKDGEMTSPQLGGAARGKGEVAQGSILKRQVYSYRGLCPHWRLRNCGTGEPSRVYRLAVLAPFCLARVFCRFTRDRGKRPLGNRAETSDSKFAALSRSHAGRRNQLRDEPWLRRRCSISSPSAAGIPTLFASSAVFGDVFLW